jgi:hypothetical protein
MTIVILVGLSALAASYPIAWGWPREEVSDE